MLELDGVNITAGTSTLPVSFRLSSLDCAALKGVKIIPQLLSNSHDTLRKLLIDDAPSLDEVLPSVAANLTHLELFADDLRALPSRVSSLSEATKLKHVEYHNVPWREVEEQNDLQFLAAALSASQIRSLDLHGNWDQVDDVEGTVQRIRNAFSLSAFSGLKRVKLSVDVEFGGEWEESLIELAEAGETRGIEVEW